MHRFKPPPRGESSCLLEAMDHPSVVQTSRGEVKGIGSAGPSSRNEREVWRWACDPPVDPAAIGQGDPDGSGVARRASAVAPGVAADDVIASPQG